MIIHINIVVNPWTCLEKFYNSILLVLFSNLKFYVYLDEHIIIHIQT